MGAHELAPASRTENSPRQAIRSVVTVNVKPPSRRNNVLSQFEEALASLLEKYDFSAKVSNGRNPSQLKLSFEFTNANLEAAESKTDEIMEALHTQMRNTYSRGSNLLAPA